MSVSHFYQGTYLNFFISAALLQKLFTFGLVVEQLGHIDVDFACLLGALVRKNDDREFSLRY